ncbi:dynein light chain cytoplasmic [Phaffia rhodozyma]|uniref:Dynein light chain n=1 Tax=Phaffia rhodozyma TaxID=264483 RepID=A0A0F7SFA0_PHARH|nr:dynein light chain cytoplasmic [Phaffia rhodozyma]
MTSPSSKVGGGGSLTLPTGETASPGGLNPTGGGVGAPSMSSPKAIIKNVDMSEEMQQEAVDVASAALEKYNIEKDIAMHVKKEFDRRYGSTWHCVVGKK